MNIFYKTWISDWKDAEKLPLAAQGLLGVMERIAVNGKPFGHVTWPGGELIDVTELAQLTNEAPERIAEYLRLMERRGVIGTAKTTAYTIKHLISRNELSKKREKSGRNGAAATNSKERGKDGLPQQTPQQVPRPTNHYPLATTEVKEKTGQKENAGDGPNTKHWWAGDIIKLNRKDYEEMFALYAGSDEQFMAYLDNRDRWYATQPPERGRGWFLATFNDLRRLASI